MWAACPWGLYILNSGVGINWTWNHLISSPAFWPLCYRDTGQVTRKASEGNEGQSYRMLTRTRLPVELQGITAASTSRRHLKAALCRSVKFGHREGGRCVALVVGKTLSWSQTLAAEVVIACKAPFPTTTTVNAELKTVSPDRKSTHCNKHHTHLSQPLFPQYWSIDWETALSAKSRLYRGYTVPLRSMLQLKI